MTGQTDPEFLRSEAYNEAEGLETRLEIQRRYRTQRMPWFLWAFEHLALQSQEQVLELGCGTGDLWRENLARLPEGLRLALSDLSEGMLADLAGELHRPDIARLVLDAQDIPFSERSFTAVIALGVLDHLPSRKRALDEISRVLRPEGRFFASAGGERHLRELKELVKPFLAGVEEVPVGGESERFGLENGANLLAPWFEHVWLTRYDDALTFTEPEPVTAYILSEASLEQSLQGKARRAFEHHVRQVLAEQGVFRVQVQKGLFKAW